MTSVAGGRPRIKLLAAIMCPMLDWLPLADSTELFVFVLLVLARLLQSILSFFALLLRLYSKYPARTNRKITTEPISERKARLKMYLPVLSLQLKKSDILMSHLCFFFAFCFALKLVALKLVFFWLSPCLGFLSDQRKQRPIQTWKVYVLERNLAIKSSVTSSTVLL